MKISLIGYGDILGRVYKLLQDRDNLINTASRNIDNHPNRAHAFSCHLGTHAPLTKLLDVDTVIYTPTPTSLDDAGYRRGYLETTKDLCQQLQPDTRLILVSSTRVYRGHPEGTIDDTAFTSPADERAHILVAMERVARALHKNTVIMRPSGIYGRRQSRYINMSESQASHTVGNRIHADDLARALVHIARLEAPKTSYICSDLQPASAAEIVRYLNQKEMVDNNSCGLRYHPSRLLNSGFEFNYPSYKEGLLGD